MKLKYKMAVIISLIIIVSSFVISNKFNNSEKTDTSIETTTSTDSISTINTVDTVDNVEIVKYPDTTEIYNKETNTFKKYIKVIKYEITDFAQEEAFVFTEGNEYLIGTNSDDIFIYFSKQVNTESNKNMKLKFIENGKAITYVCKETEVHHLKFSIVSSQNKKDPYEATIYFVVPEK